METIATAPTDRTSAAAAQPVEALPSSVPATVASPRRELPAAALGAALARAPVLRFILEALVGCPGSCSGCGLEARMAPGRGLWDRAMAARVAALAAERAAAWPGQGRAAEVLKVNLVQGDFLALDPAGLDDVAALVGALEAATAAIPTKAIAFTTTALGRADRLAAACRRLLAIMEAGTAHFSIEVVIDPVRIGHAAGRALLHQNVRAIQEAFGCPVLYTYQIGPTVAGTGLSGRLLYDTARDDGARLINLNLLPTRTTARPMAEAWGAMMDLAAQVYGEWAAHRDLYLVSAFSIAANARVHQAESGTDPAWWLAVEGERRQNALYVTHDGRVARRYFGISEVVTPVPAFGFEAPDLAVSAADRARAATRTEALVLGELLRPAACQDCPVRAVCAASGGGVLLRQLRRHQTRPQPGACPLAWRELLARIVADDRARPFQEGAGINVV